MGKQKKTPGKQQPTKSDRDSQRPELAEQAAMGNAALLAGIGPAGELSFGADMAARDLAAPRVGRAVLALELLPRETAQVGRFLDIIANSRLPDERKGAISERIERDHQAASGISEAVLAHSGEDTREIRTALVTTLEGLWNELQGGELDGRVWTSPDGSQRELSDAVSGESSESAAEALVSELSTPATQQLCSAISLALMMLHGEEEEEESLQPEYGEEIS